MLPASLQIAWKAWVQRASDRGRASESLPTEGSGPFRDVSVRIEIFPEALHFGKCSAIAFLVLNINNFAALSGSFRNPVRKSEVEFLFLVPDTVTADKGPYKAFPPIGLLLLPDAYPRTLVIEELDARLLQSLLDLR